MRGCESPAWVEKAARYLRSLVRITGGQYMRIIIAGSGLLGASVMGPLLESDHDVVGLVQNGRLTPERRRNTWKLGAFFLPPGSGTLSLATRNRLPILWIDTMEEPELEAIRALDPDLIVVCGFGIIFKKPMLDLPNIGCVNVHSSLLPKHRGPSPFAHVILANESESGVTFHAMDESIDTGDILHQELFAVTPMDTGLSVYHKACEAAEVSILDVVDDIEMNGLCGQPQNPAEASYDPRMTHETAAIDWRDPAEDIERRVRATQAYFPSWFMHRGRLIRVTRATFDPREVTAAPGEVLETRPYPVVATGRGRLIIHAAHVTRPIPWSWPAPWARLRCADVLD